jgi:hypothetical protein
VELGRFLRGYRPPPGHWRGVLRARRHGVGGQSLPGWDAFVPELSFPVGVGFAISADHPVFCWMVDLNTNPTTETRIVNECPQQPSSGSYGGSHGFGNLGDPSGTWPHGQGIAYEMQVPVVSSRQLRGTLANPCDCVDGSVKTIDGNDNPVLNSNAGLFDVDAPGGGGGTPGGNGGGTPPTGGGTTPGGPQPDGSTPPGGGPAISIGAGSGKRPVALGRLVAPASYSIRRLRRRGLTVRVHLGYPNSRVDARLVGRGTAVLGRANVRAAGPGWTAIKLRITGKGARMLRRTRGLRARLQVTVTPPAGPKSTKSLSLRLKR